MTNSWYRNFDKNLYFSRKQEYIFTSHIENKLWFIWRYHLHLIMDYLNYFAKSRLKKLRKECLYFHVLVLEVNSNIYATYGVNGYVN